MSQSNLPTNKMSAVGISGALTVIVVYLLSLVGINLPDGVSAALTIVISFTVGYLIPEKGV